MFGGWIAQTPTLNLAHPSCQPSEEEAGGSRGQLVTKTGSLADAKEISMEALLHNIK